MSRSWPSCSQARQGGFAKRNFSRCNSRDPAPVSSTVLQLEGCMTQPMQHKQSGVTKRHRTKLPVVTKKQQASGCRAGPGYPRRPADGAERRAGCRPSSEETAGLLHRVRAPEVSELEILLVCFDNASGWRACRDQGLGAFDFRG